MKARYMVVRAFECSVVDTDWKAVINERTASRAKAKYFRHVREAWPSIPFTAFRVRVLGRPVTSEDFERVATYRGVDFRCGDRVRVGQDGGVIVGHNGSANFDVLFDAGTRYPDQRRDSHFTPPSNVRKFAPVEPLADEDGWR
jgi:hypothetical protein